MNQIANWIEDRIKNSNSSLEEEIDKRSLYFRVSVIGSCNLSCPFCHNEGAPTKGKLDPENCSEYFEIARTLGFKRIQFTGGEPTLHPQLPKFINKATRYFSDIGITTNGTRIEPLIEELVNNGLTRVHVSLQVESLEKAGQPDCWGIPAFLLMLLNTAKNNPVLKVRINLPVPLLYIDQAKFFLRLVAPYGCDINVFSILPKLNSIPMSYQAEIDKLSKMITDENEIRLYENNKGRVFIRDYKEPVGLRCVACKAKPLCKEKSHSLRLGADHVLRPCLATRDWDIPLKGAANLKELFYQATLLSLDYTW